MIHDPIPAPRIHAATCRCPGCAPRGPGVRRPLHPAVFGLLGIPTATAIAAAIDPAGTLAALIAIVGR